MKDPLRPKCVNTRRVLASLCEESIWPYKPWSASKSLLVINSGCNTQQAGSNVIPGEGRWSSRIIADHRAAGPNNLQCISPPAIDWLNRNSQLQFFIFVHRGRSSVLEEQLMIKVFLSLWHTNILSPNVCPSFTKLLLLQDIKRQNIFVTRATAWLVSWSTSLECLPQQMLIDTICNFRDL